MPDLHAVRKADLVLEPSLQDLFRQQKSGQFVSDVKQKFELCACTVSLVTEEEDVGVVEVEVVAGQSYCRLFRGPGIHRHLYWLAKLRMLIFWQLEL